MSVWYGHFQKNIFFSSIFLKKYKKNHWKTFFFGKNDKNMDFRYFMRNKRFFSIFDIYEKWIGFFHEKYKIKYLYRQLVAGFGFFSSKFHLPMVKT